MPRHKGEQGGIGSSAWYAHIETFLAGGKPRLGDAYIQRGPVRPGYKPGRGISENMSALWIATCAGLIASTARSSTRELLSNDLRQLARHHYDADELAHMGGEQMSTEYAPHHLNAALATLYFCAGVQELRWLSDEAKAWLARHLSARLLFRAPIGAHPLARLRSFAVGVRFTGGQRTDAYGDYLASELLSDRPTMPCPVRAEALRHAEYLGGRIVQELYPRRQPEAWGDLLNDLALTVPGPGVHFRHRVEIELCMYGQRARLPAAPGAWNAPQWMAEVRYYSGFAQRFVWEDGRATAHGGAPNGPLDPVLDLGATVARLVIDAQGVREEAA